VASRALVAGLPGVIETIVAMTATVLLVAAVNPEPGLLVLGAVLAMILSRSKLVDTWRGRLESLIVLPLLAVVTAGVALLFATVPVVGAVAFTAGLFLSVWLRRFGPTWQRIGSLIALPFVTLLVAPAHLGAGAAPLAALVSVIALAVVVAVRVLGGLVWKRSVAPPELPLPPGALRPIASTRMALQLAASVAAAFVLGFWLFPGHWAWVVLTAYLVQSANRGRADVVYKSGLRILGAVAGTVLALLLSGVRLEGPPLVVVLLVSLAVGLFLRGISYAFWALVVTLALTLLQGGPVDLWPRVLAILVGAVCGMLASWFLLPIRSEGVLRRRIANVLGELGSRPSLGPVEEVAAPFVLLARVPFAPRRLRRAGEWVQLIREIAAGDVPATARPALAAARRAMREPEAITPALRELLAAME
jgi:hypothetical protein